MINVAGCCGMASGFDIGQREEISKHEGTHHSDITPPVKYHLKAMKLIAADTAVGGGLTPDDELACRRYSRGSCRAEIAAIS